MNWPKAPTKKTQTKTMDIYTSTFGPDGQMTPPLSKLYENARIECLIYQMSHLKIDTTNDLFKLADEIRDYFDQMPLEEDEAEPMEIDG